MSRCKKMMKFSRFFSKSSFKGMGVYFTLGLLSFHFNSVALKSSFANEVNEVFDSHFSSWAYCEVDGWFPISEGTARNSTVIPAFSTLDYTAYSFCFKVEGSPLIAEEKAKKFCQGAWTQHPLLQLNARNSTKNYTLAVIRENQKACQADLAWSLNNLINRFPSESFQVMNGSVGIQSLRFER